MKDEKLSADVRMIQGGIRLVRRRWKRLLVALVAAALLAVGFSGIYTVPTNQTGALFLLGELVQDDIQSGIHYRLPRLHEVHMANTSEVRRMRLQIEDEGLISLVTADDNIIEVDVALQYTISDYGRYLMGGEDWERVLQLTVVSVLNQLVARVRVEELLTTGKGAIQTQIRQRAQELLNRYGSGLTLMSVSLVAVRPPREAVDSFRRVADAKSERSRLISDAEAERSRALAAARGKASSLLREAESQANERVTIAQGDAERFAEIAREYRQAKAITRSDLYRKAMSKVIPRARLLLYDPEIHRGIELNLALD